MKFLLVLVALLLPGFATDTRSQVAAEESPARPVVVLEPLVQFEEARNDSSVQARDARDRRSVPKSAFEDEAFGSRLLAAATRELEGRKLQVVKAESLSESVVAPNDWTLLQGMSSRLARGIVNQDARKILERIASANDRCAVLVQFMRVKSGPGGSWNPWSGAITSSLSSTLLQSALVACTGDVIWKDEVFVRKTFRSDSEEFNRNLQLLFRTLRVN